MKNTVLLVLSWLSLVSLGSCTEAPPQCIPGIVVGTTCTGGYLIQIDEKYPIGQALQFSGDGSTNSLPGPAATPATYTNVIEVFGLYDPAILRGKQLYFQLREPKADDALPHYCTANVIGYTAPQFVVTNYADTSCYAFAAE
ncbi:hypothetical protein H8B15_16320 [Hymenobacter sp. BT507]|uniref:Uncharacterized protein n=1 Tax=Hymenobacter citatus TaxID=2763506 RepID=A0ABR7MN28_9BACT|nr:hypothetical protein [Hymenobacter citatus]MBC6612489.1 hypothetical protein [Hymenobacter citatus]